jgi:hypothetical protein
MSEMKTYNWEDLVLGNKNVGAYIMHELSGNPEKHPDDLTRKELKKLGSFEKIGFFEKDISLNKIKLVHNNIYDAMEHLLMDQKYDQYNEYENRRYNENNEIPYFLMKREFTNADKSFALKNTHWSSSHFNDGGDHRCYGNHDTIQFDFGKKEIFSISGSCSCHPHPLNAKPDYTEHGHREYSITIFDEENIEDAINVLQKGLSDYKKNKKISSIVHKTGLSREGLVALLS